MQTLTNKRKDNLCKSVNINSKLKGRPNDYLTVHEIETFQTMLRKIENLFLSVLLTYITTELSNVLFVNCI